MQPNVNVNPQTPNMPMHHGRGSRTPWIVLTVVVVVALLVLGFLFRDKIGGSSTAKASGYKAVFLTNGQVYFGKLSGASGSYATLKDIYYLQVNQELQSGDQAQQQQSQQQPQLSLVKLGNELHGPVDTMKINKDQILFYEDLKEDGRVMQAIREYQKNPNQGADQSQQQQTPANQTPATQTPATNNNQTTPATNNQQGR